MRSTDRSSAAAAFAQAARQGPTPQAPHEEQGPPRARPVIGPAQFPTQPQPGTRNQRLAHAFNRDTLRVIREMVPSFRERALLMGVNRQFYDAFAGERSRERTGILEGGATPQSRDRAEAWRYGMDHAEIPDDCVSFEDWIARRWWEYLEHLPLAQWWCSRARDLCTDRGIDMYAFRQWCAARRKQGAAIDGYLDRWPPALRLDRDPLPEAGWRNIPFSDSPRQVYSWRTGWLVGDEGGTLTYYAFGSLPRQMAPPLRADGTTDRFAAILGYDFYMVLALLESGRLARCALQKRTRVCEPRGGTTTRGWSIQFELVLRDDGGLYNLRNGTPYRLPSGFDSRAIEFNCLIESSSRIYHEPKTFLAQGAARSTAAPVWFGLCQRSFPLAPSSAVPDIVRMQLLGRGPAGAIHKLAGGYPGSGSRSFDYAAEVDNEGILVWSVETPSQKVDVALVRRTPATQRNSWWAGLRDGVRNAFATRPTPEVAPPRAARRSPAPEDGLDAAVRGSAPRVAALKREPVLAVEGVPFEDTRAAALHALEDTAAVTRQGPLGVDVFLVCEARHRVPDLDGYCCSSSSVEGRPYWYEIPLALLQTPGERAARNALLFSAGLVGDLKRAHALAVDGIPVEASHGARLRVAEGAQPTVAMGDDGVPVVSLACVASRAIEGIEPGATRNGLHVYEIPVARLRPTADL